MDIMTGFFGILDVLSERGVPGSLKYELVPLITIRRVLSRLHVDQDTKVTSIVLCADMKGCHVVVVSVAMLAFNMGEVDLLAALAKYGHLGGIKADLSLKRNRHRSTTA
jgi:hypothetical protein